MRTIIAFYFILVIMAGIITGQALSKVQANQIERIKQIESIIGKR